MEVMTTEERKRKEAEKKKTAKETLKSRGRTMMLVARLARRPLTKSPRFDELRVIRELRSLDSRRLEQVIKCGHSVLDKVSKSISYANVKLGMAHAPGGVFTKLMVRESFMGAPGGKEFVRKEANRMSHGWSRKGVSCFILVQLMSKAGQSINSSFNSTGEWGRKKKGSFG